MFLFLPQLLRSEAPPPPAPSEAPKDNESLAELLESFKQAKSRANLSMNDARVCGQKRC